MSPTTTPLRIDPHRSVGLEAPSYTFKQSDHALIIGAGLAGCAIAKTLADKGMRCTVFDASSGIAAGASSVPTAIFKPYVSLHPSTEQRFINTCFERLLETLANERIAIQTRGLYQTIRSDTDIRQSLYWQRHSTADNNTHTPPHSLFSPDAGAIRPAELCKRWIKHRNIHCRTNVAINSINKTDGLWSVKGNDQQTLGTGQLLVLANAMGINKLLPDQPFFSVAGQINHFSCSTSGPVICNRGYLVPANNGVWSGATFHRGETTEILRSADTEKNLQRCLQYFPVASNQPVSAWCGIRCTTPDHMPVAGAVPDLNHYATAYRELHHGRRQQDFPAGQYEAGLYVMAGLGSRGLVQALYTAECLADIIFGGQVIGESIKQAIHPARFLMRRLKKRSYTPAI